MKLLPTVFLVILLSLVLSSCSTNQRLEKLGYNQVGINEVKQDGYNKYIIGNNIKSDQYEMIKDQKSFQESNMEYYLRLLNNVYDIKDADKIVVGANLIVQKNDNPSSAFNSDNIKEQIEELFKPKLELKSNEINASKSGNVDELIKRNLIAESKFDGDITQNAEITSNIVLDRIGSYDVKIKVNDSKGYEAELEGKIKVVDKERPTIDVPSNLQFLANDTIDLLLNVKANDNLDGDITSKIKVDKGAFNSEKENHYKITYSVSDSSGNIASKQAIVTVLPSAKLNETFTVNRYDLTVKSYSFNRTDSEPVSGLYQYYNASDNSIFLILKLQIKNNYDIQRSPFEIFGDDDQKLKAELIYDGQYNYDSVAHRLENNWYYLASSLKPLLSNTSNLTFEVPIEVKNSNKSVVLKFSGYKSSGDPVYLRLK